jgi:hypothetical protein
MKISKELTAWWSEDKQWFCLLVDDGTSRATVSLTRLQAIQLRSLAAYQGRVEPTFRTND